MDLLEPIFAKFNDFVGVPPLCAHIDVAATFYHDIEFFSVALCVNSVI